MSLGPPMGHPAPTYWAALADAHDTVVLGLIVPTTSGVWATI